MNLIRDFKKESFNKTYAYIDEKTIYKRISESTKLDFLIAYIAEKDEKIVGLIAGIVVPSYTDENKKIGMELIWIVNKENRGSSIGTRLFKILEDTMFQRDADSVVFIAGSYSVLTDNSHLLEKVYKRNGYEKLEVHYIKRRK